MSWQAIAETWIRTAGGADAPAEMYLLDGDTLPAELQPTECIGCTSWHLSQAVRPWLESRGEWRGEGFAAIVFPSRVASAHGLTVPQVIDAACIYVAAHEYAHELDRLAFVTAWRGIGAAIPPTPEPALAARRLMESNDPGPPWLQHQKGFIRAACHLSFRAMKADHWLPVSNIGVAGSGYGLSDVEQYRQALGDELAARQAEPITAILTREPPAEFAELFRQDVKAWQASHPDM